MVDTHFPGSMTEDSKGTAFIHVITSIRVLCLWLKELQLAYGIIPADTLVISWLAFHHIKQDRVNVGHVGRGK